MTCPVTDEQLFSWIDREAPDLQEHLAVCPACREKAATLRGTIGEVAQAVASPIQQLPARIGDYDIHRLLGVGGEGWVFEAQQQSPSRRVALKVVKGGCLIDANDARRLRREAETLALLKHPGIASIYQAGSTDDGQQYFAMELVEGEPLLEYARKRQIPLGNRLELFLKVCEALEYAHQQGVIHRDLKPSNILVESEDRPKILDFGLARLTRRNGELTVTVLEPGKIVGTLPYMSPEHARGDTAAVSVASDVYSLTVILYELLTGHPPYQLDPKAPHQALRIICEELPQRPSRFNRRLRGDLETILLTGLAKEPARRYASVAALAEDIRRHLAHEMIAARRPSATYRAHKLIARNRLTAALVAVILIMAVGFSTWVTAIYTQARVEQRRVDKPTSPAELGMLRAQLAEMNWTAGQMSKAEEQCRTALSKLQGILPESHHVILDNRILLGRILTRRGNPKEAEPILRKAMQNYAEYYPGQKGLIAEAKSALGECLTRLGTFRQAELLLTESYPVIKASRGPDHRRTQEARQALVDLYMALGKPDKAREYGDALSPTAPKPVPSVKPAQP